MKFFYGGLFILKRSHVNILAAVLVLMAAVLLTDTLTAAAAGSENSPGKGYYKTAPPSWYGSVVMKKNINRGAEVAPVVFKHWVHRRFYTCNVCHADLGFAWKAGGTDIRHSDIDAGKKCGACHNGDLAFGREKCNRCHSYGRRVAENSRLKYALKDFPADDFGNKIDWVKALHEDKITPQVSLGGKGKLTSLDKDVLLPAYSRARYAPSTPDVMFPHKSHTEILDCAACHPARFKPKKGGNPEMDMMKIINGEYCGACHGKVAFPLENCFRCHSVERAVPDWITGADVAKEKAEKEKAKKKAKEEAEKRKKKKKKKRRTTLF
ncbi:MAG: c(7)-type cytochrome triheme domain-containing protein [Thermodesulfobacteriota bacterium]